MKKIVTLTLTGAVILSLLQSCGPSEEEMRRAERDREQARLDSLEQVWAQEREQMRRDSLERARQQPPVPPVSEVRETPSAPVIQYDPTGRFSVQVRAWRSESRARQQVEEWKRRGFEHVYVEKYGNEATGDVWFRVRIGNVATRQMASLLQQRLRNEFRTDSWIATTGD